MVATLDKPTVGEYETKAPTIQEYESPKYPAPTEWLHTKEVPSVMAEQWLAEPKMQPQKARPSAINTYPLGPFVKNAPQWGVPFFRGYALGFTKATQIPALAGQELPQAETLEEKIGEGVGATVENIVELITATKALKAVGMLPKGMSFLQKAFRTGTLFGTQQMTKEARKAAAEVLHDKSFGYRGGIAALEAFAFGAVLSMAFSGASGIWGKLKPTEQAKALKILGLKKGATLDQINQASRKMALKYHPDKAKGMVDKFHKVIKSRDYLRNYTQTAGKDIITRADKSIRLAPRLLAGETTPTIKEYETPPTVGKLAPQPTPAVRKPTEVVKVPPKPAEAKPVAKAEAITSVTKELSIDRLLDIQSKAKQKAKGESFVAAAKKNLEEGKHQTVRIDFDDNGVPFIADGNARIQAAQELGLKVLPVEVLKPVAKAEPAKVALKEAPKAEKVVPLSLRTDAFNRIMSMIDKGITPELLNTQLKASQNNLNKEQQNWLENYAKEAQPPAQVKGKPGKLDVTPLLKAHQTFMKVLEPAKAVEMKLGKEPYAAVIKGIHQTDVGRIEFTEAQLVGHDKSIGKLGEWFNKFSEKDLRNLMLSRGQPTSVGAEVIQENAINNLPKELKGIRVQNAIEQIANFNYAYLQKVAGDDINKVADYFYGIYKDPQKVDRFLDYWRTTKRFTKEKKLPTVADAVDYGLELRNYNPVENLKAEYLAISHLEGMLWLKDELMRMGKGKYIDETLASPMDWRKVNDPVFRDLRLQPDLAHLINNLIATNKITKVPLANTLRQINNFTRTVKFIGSAFHLLSVAKQSVADSGYLGFLYKPTALRGITRGFRANDPIFRTTAYKDYIRHGGGHRYSVESEARRAFSKAVDELNRNMGRAVKVGALPLKIPTGFVNWMFQSYIPKVKYSKFLDVMAEQEKKLGRTLTSPEKIDIIKEQQNFYGMMNERLFGRSGTVTSALRFYFMSPGYAEGNYRTMLKSATQWGGKTGFKANRSRSNIINSWLISGIGATVGTLAFTGRPPKKPETLDDARDLFKIDTGKKDQKGRKIMIDLMTYDKDYWNVAFNTLRLRPDVAVGKSWKRIGGMKAPTAEIIVDLALMSMGKAIYDWKGDRVVEITDPFLQKAMKLTTHEVKNLVPISVSVFQQSKKRDIDTTIAAIETLMGLRPTKTEKDIREQKLISKMYSLAGQREELSYYIGQSTDPKRTVDKYNKTVNDILESPYIPKSMKAEWGPKLLVDYDNVVTWKRYPAGKMTNAELQRAFDAHTLSIPYKRRGEPFRPIGAPKKGSERRVNELKAEAQRRGIELTRGPRRPPRR